MSDQGPSAIGPPSHGNVAGRPVVLAYSDVAAEYTALRNRAVVTDRSARTRVRLSGAKAAEMLTGLVTNDVVALKPGEGQYAAALSAKGKIVADVRIFVTQEGILTDAPTRAGEGWLGMVKKFINPRAAPHVDETATTKTLGVFGPNAHHVIEGMTGINSSALTVLPPYAHVSIAFEGASILVVHSPDIGLDGFEIFVPADRFDRLWQRAARSGATPLGHTAWEVARVEAGRPEWGIDMDETTIPQEANLEQLDAISFTKGCYVGQEVVARIHFRGHVNRHLRGLRTAGTEAPPSGAVLFDTAGKEVGDIRSSVSSVRLGGIALGMVRREVEIGTTLVARREGDPEFRVDVSAVPFPS